MITDRKLAQGPACGLRYHARHEGRATIMIGGDAAAQAQSLRDNAAALLQEAAQSTDLALRDALTRRALAQIEEARRLLDEARASMSQPATRLH